MRYYIGIDLGTSGVKLLLLDQEGSICRSASEPYPICFPQAGWAEQDPEDWWQAVKACIAKLTEGIDCENILGIGCAGQMHGLVILDENDQVIRPAILWNDGRTQKQTDELNQTFGLQGLSSLTANIAFAGFTAPKLLWLRENEPDNFSRIKKIMLPKDYINYRLTGVHACDYSDASGTLLLDVKNKCWSQPMLDYCGIGKEQLPRLYESFSVIGTVKPGLELPTTVKVVTGAGDNTAAAIGTATVGEGNCNISLGTSGTIFISSDAFRVDENNALHAFAHADGGYHLMGCMLSAASCNQWLFEKILKTDDYAAEFAEIKEENLGKNPVFFLPYLMGERSPINDTDARGAFLNMSMDTSRSDMTQAVMEGVAFALRDSFEVAKRLGMRIEKTTLCGGGARSAIWQTILANVLDLPLELPKTEEGPGYGAALLAMTGCGEFTSVSECCRQLCRIKQTIMPDRELASRYETQYRKFSNIYPILKTLFPMLKSGREDI